MGLEEQVQEGQVSRGRADELCKKVLGMKEAGDLPTWLAFYLKGGFCR